MKTNKILTLRNILKEYSKYFRYFDKCTCYTPKVKCRLDTARKQSLFLKYYKQYMLLDNEQLMKPYKINIPIFCIYFVNITKEENVKSLKRYIPVTNIDKIIARYRSKLHYEIDKNNKRVSPKGNIIFFKLKMFD